MRIAHLQHKDSSVFNYRFDRPLGSLGAKKYRTLLQKNKELTLQELADRWKKKCDILVIKYIDDFHTLDVIYTLRNLGAFKVVVDLDDNIWAIPPGNPAMGNPKAHANRCFMLSESVESADWVTISTEPLKKAIENLNDNIAVLPNYVIPSEWNFKRKKHKKTRIGWVWSPTHGLDMGEVIDPLTEISKRDDVEIVIFGTSVDVFPFKTTNIPGVKYTEYPRVFTEAGIDISIAPLESNSFNECKSNIKWLESTLAGAAFIGSNVYPYKKSVKHGITGYLAKSKKDWFKHMEYLIENPMKREELQKNALKVVLENHTSNKQWKDFYTYISMK